MKRRNVPKHYRKLYDRALTGRSSMTAIRCHCLMCVGWQSSEVATCTATECPLYPYRFGKRPGFAGEPGGAESELLRAYPEQSEQEATVPGPRGGGPEY